MYLSTDSHLQAADAARGERALLGMCGVILCAHAAGDASSKSILFCIGGPYGHTEAVRDRADQVIRLSDLVLNHQVARVVLLEQIYRGWTIIRNEPYHH